MTVCLGCLKEKKLKNSYCTKCIKNVFDGVVPLPLDFGKKEFYVQRNELAPRMSMSGVQDKISLKFEKNKLVTTAINGRYILKPIPTSSHIKNESDVVYNEHLSMLISQEIFKINTAKCALIQFNDGEMAYITKRFDYEDETGLKYDQEDFASILDVSSASHGANYKYEAKTYLDCANAIKMNVPASVITLEDFFKRILLNYLISNGDAHLKNFSLYSLANKNDYVLTPNYDILNTRYHVNEMYGDMALDFMDEFTKSYEVVGYYTYADFYQFAQYLNIKDIRFEKIMNLINSSEERIIEMVNSSFLSDNAKKYYINSYSDRLKRLNYKIKL